MKVPTLAPELLERIDAYWRAVNFLSVSQNRLAYRRTNHGNIHVRGDKEEGTMTTSFDMTVLNDMDRFHLVLDVVDRVPKTGPWGIALKQKLEDKRTEHRRYINQHGQDLPEIRDWRWGARRAADGGAT